MKKLRIILIFVSLFFIKTSFTSAQVSVSFNINSQPLWGPVSYDYVEYYYMPEYDLYYHAPKAKFVYLKGNKWLYSNTLPYRCRNADLYSTYKVVINEPKPYLKNIHYSNYYKKFKHDHYSQGIIRDSRDVKYTGRKDHPHNSHNNAGVKNQENEHREGYNQGNKKSSKKKGNKKGKN